MPTVMTNKIRLHYEERVSGDSLILIMGLGAPSSLWEVYSPATQVRVSMEAGVGEVSENRAWLLEFQIGL